MTELVAGSVRLWAAVALLLAAAFRWTPRLVPGGPRASSEVFLRVVLVTTVMMVLSAALLGALGVLGGWTLLAFALALYAASRASRVSPAVWSLSASRRRAVLWWPAGLAAALAAVHVAVYLPASPVNWDGMTYHLYFPSRWLEEGRLFHVPTVFSDDSSAFAPQNGALFFAWQMALLGRDATTNVSQVVCLVFLAAAVYRLALLGGLRRRAAIMAAAVLFWVAPLSGWTFSANVDVFMVAFWTGAVYWLGLYLARRDRGSLVACGLASGLAAGTKTLGLPLAAVPAVILIVLLLVERRWKELATFAGAAVGGGGWWYVKNLWLYGNPLFPLDFGVPGLRFAGVYTAETLRRGSVFHIDEAARWLRSVGTQLGPVTVLLFAAGLAGLVGLVFRALRRERSRGVAALGFLGFAAAWAWYVFEVVPHNNQARFLLPFLVAASLGWAAGLDALPSHRARAGLFLLAIGALAGTSRPDLGWRYGLGRLAASGVDVVGWMALAVPAGAVAVWACGRGRARPRRAALLAGAALALTVGLAAHHAGRSRIAFLAQADYRAWGPGYLMFNDPSFAPRRIAYSGLNIPYALAGARGQHSVVYCNTQGGRDDGLYEFWARERRLYSTHQPGLYRGDDDFDVWSSCLAARRIDMVVLFSVISLGLPSHWRLSEAFPIEREWMRRRPESFRRILAGDRAEIYEVVGRAGEARSSLLVDDTSADDGGEDLEVLQLPRR